MSCSLCDRDHIPEVSLLFSCRLPLCPSKWSITRIVGTCGSMAILSPSTFSAGYFSTLVHAALLGFAMHLLILLGNLPEWLWSPRQCHWGQLWHMIFLIAFLMAVHGGLFSLFPVGCSKLVSKAEFMEAVFVISLRSMFPDGILVTEFGWSIVPGCLLWCAVVLDWCMTLNFIPQMISAKGYGCITGHFLLILCSISRFEPDVM